LKAIDSARVTALVAKRAVPGHLHQAKGYARDTITNALALSGTVSRASPDTMRGHPRSSDVGVPRWQASLAPIGFMNLLHQNRSRHPRHVRGPQTPPRYSRWSRKKVSSIHASGLPARPRKVTTRSRGAATIAMERAIATMCTTTPPMTMPTRPTRSSSAATRHADAKPSTITVSGHTTTALTTAAVSSSRLGVERALR
jgi:hypothetical protein